MLDPVAHKIIWTVGHRSWNFFGGGCAGARGCDGGGAWGCVDPHSAGGPPPGCPASPRRRARRRAGAWRRWRGCSRLRPGPPIRCFTRTRLSTHTYPHDPSAFTQGLLVADAPAAGAGGGQGAGGSDAEAAVLLAESTGRGFSGLGKGQGQRERGSGRVKGIGRGSGAEAVAGSRSAGQRQWPWLGSG